MRENLLASLRCAKCGSHLRLSEHRTGEAAQVEIRNAQVRCIACTHAYPVHGGIVDFLVDPSEALLAEIAGNRLMAETDRGACDDDWLLALPGSHVVQRPEMVVHDEEADLLGLLECVRGRQHLRVLDIGAGTCWTTQRWAHARHRAIASDISLEKFVGLGSADVFIAHTGEYFERIRFDMDQRWPIADGALDVVAAMSCIHHAQNLEGVFREVARVLDGNGLLLLVETTRSRFVPEESAHFGEREREVFHRHERIYTQDDYRQAARGAGLALEFRAAPSFMKKVDYLTQGRPLVGRNSFKHKVARRLSPLLQKRAVREAAFGPMFGALNWGFGTQFIGVGKPTPIADGIS